MRVQHYVAGFLFDKDRQRVALIEKKKPEWQRGKLNGIGGKIEPTDENVNGAMEREFEEETGVKVRNWRHFCTLTGAGDWSVHFFSATGDLTKLQTQEEEEIVIVALNRIPDAPVIPNLRWLIPLALDGGIVCASVHDRA